MPDLEARPRGRYEELAWMRQDLDLSRWPARTAEECDADGFWWDQEAADRIVEFAFRYCKHYKGRWAGRPVEFSEEQAERLGIIFGWKRPDGSRRFRVAYNELPRKQGKSVEGGIVGLYLLVADGEPGAECYSLATKKDQAKIVWDTADAMVRKSHSLRKWVKPMRNRLVMERTTSYFEPLSSDSDTLDGLMPHAAIVDEMHAHKSRHLLDVVTDGMGTRWQPLTFIITTAGIYNQESPGWQEHSYARGVLEGTIVDETYFAFIAHAEEDDDPYDPNTWFKANPHLGITIPVSYYEERATKAKALPSYRNTFLRYYLNRWVQQVDRWLDAERWQEAEAPAPLDELRKLPSWGGLDLSSTTDLSWLTLAVPRDGGFDLICRAWCPEDRIMDRAKMDNVPYDEWVEQGWLTPTPGNVIDYDFIRATIAGPAVFADPELQERMAQRLEEAGEPPEGLAAAYSLQELGFDPYNATQLSVQLQGDGIICVPFRQGFLSMNEPSKRFEREVMQGKVRHGGNPILTWMVGHVTIREDPSGNIKPDKKRSAERIDGVVASIMAIGRATAGDGEESSVYEERGLLTIGGDGEDDADARG